MVRNRREKDVGLAKGETAKCLVLPENGSGFWGRSELQFLVVLRHRVGNRLVQILWSRLKGQSAEVISTDYRIPAPARSLCRCFVPFNQHNNPQGNLVITHQERLQLQSKITLLESSRARI